MWMTFFSPLFLFFFDALVLCRLLVQALVFQKVEINISGTADYEKVHVFGCLFPPCICWSLVECTWLLLDRSLLILFFFDFTYDS